ncbi:MAG: rane protein [Rhodospirillales bacterium]|nr:rane protein [Rhodospirillales bacterium]
MPLPQPSPLILALLLATTGAEAGEMLDPADESFRAASYAQAWAGPLNADHRWSNPASGHSGRVRATKERIDPASRQPCREIQEDVMAGDRPATGYAVGCRGSDGAWRIVQSSAASAIVPADVTPYVAPADINAAGSGGASDLSGLPPQVRILVPMPARGTAGTTPPAPR